MRDPGIADYQPPSQGPFMCGHCEYLRSGKFGTACMKPEAVSDIIEHFPTRKLPDGAAKVERGGCCNYYHSMGGR